MSTMYEEWKLTNRKLKKFQKIAASLQGTIAQVYPESSIHIFGSSVSNELLKCLIFELTNN